MNKCFAALGLYSALLTGVATAESTTSIEKVEVKGTRTPLYDTRDINAAALGMKDTQLLPLSIQSFSEELILNQRARTLGDILANDASVQNTSFGTVFDLVSLRGFQLDWINGLRRDGLSLAPFQDVALENIQRIDVIKGASSLLSGFNNPGGTINYVTKRPTEEQFVDLTAEVRSRAGRYLHIDTGGAFNDDMGYRVNIAAEDNGDFTGGDDLTRYFASAAFDWFVSDDLFIRLDADFQDKKTVSQPIIGLAVDPEDSTKSVLPPYVDLSETLLGQPWARYETQTSNIAIRADYSLSDNWQWVNQVALSSNDRFTIFPDIYQVDLQGNVLSSGILVTPDEKYETLSGHSFLSGQFETGFINHELVAGISLINYDSADGRWFSLPNPVASIFNPVHTERPEFPEYPDPTFTETTQDSLFLTDTLHFDDTFYATLGLRHIRYKQKQRASGEQWAVLEDATFNTPMLGFNYNPTDNLAFYISYSEGIGEGGVAVIGSGAENEGQRLGPQESKQVETGVKLRTDHTTYTLAIFQVEKKLEYHNQISNFFVQDGTQVHKGVELNINGEIMQGLSAVTSFVYMDTALEDLIGELTLNNNRAPNVPNFQGNAFLDYQLPFVDGLNVNFGFYHVGKRQQNVQNTLTLPSYNRFDLGAKYELTALDTTLRFRAENVFDKEFWLSAGASGIDWGVAPGRGRTFVFSATHTF